MSPNLKQLVRDLAPTLASYRPRFGGKIEGFKPKKRYPSQSAEAVRARYLKRLAKMPMTEHRRKYGKLQVEARFARIAEKLGISHSAARMRYYRGQVPKRLLNDGAMPRRD